MCGIVAVLRRDGDRPPPDVAAIETELSGLVRVAEALDAGTALDAPAVDRLADGARRVDAALRGAPAIAALLDQRILLARLESHASRLVELAAQLDDRVDATQAATTGADDIEALSEALVHLRDVVWAIAKDRLPTARRVDELAGGSVALRAIAAYASIQTALSALDRLEVRGRDSAGLHVLVVDHGLDLADPVVAALLEPRASDPLFRSGSVMVAGESLAFTYKTAREVGELGENVRALRAEIEGDELLRIALTSGAAEATVLGHTRWASVGIISEANAHPLNHTEVDGRDGPYVVASLNGDVDNYSDLAAAESLAIPAEITTDAKVIPALVSRRLDSGAAPLEAFRSAVATFEGSVAIAAQTATDPGRVLLAQRGSGQALYVGLADDLFVVSSEPYGLVEDADRYFRLDGERPLHPDNPASAGQIVELDAALAGSLDGVTRCAYDGTVLPVGAQDLLVPEITTRDVDRGSYPHFLLKEISEAPASFRKTLRGRIRGDDDALSLELGERTLPPELARRLAEREIRHVYVIGQGTAAIAGQSLSAALAAEVGDDLHVEAIAATELSGFAVRDDMRDTLVIAISQSGTTTDTNRTVDVVRARGGAVISIVNRRQSDLVDRSDGVLYTADGRDVEMSVASTKAFYAQIAAGWLLAMGIADTWHGSVIDVTRRQRLLEELRALPEAMSAVLAEREVIARAARTFAPRHRSWAVVGNGPNQIAAREVRIKLSELCYKSIAFDLTEDKKHIDLSAEPLVIVCAAGLSGSTADDVGKEIAIYRAHKASPIVIASVGDDRFRSAVDRITVPAVHPELGFVLAAMAGHLFGYEAALAIDGTAIPLRAARSEIEAVVSEGVEALVIREVLASRITGPAGEFFATLRSGSYDGAMEASTAVRLAALFRYATGALPLDSYQIEFGRVGTPGVVIDDLLAALGTAIEELTRPVDAIRHQAKTVTVGISRSDETLLRVRLVAEVLASGSSRDSLSYRTLRNLAALDEAVDTVLGYTRYRIEGDVESGATIHVVDRGGVARGIPSRTDRDPHLRGTKHRAATEREVTVFRGGSDNRTLIAVPEVKGSQVTGMTLLHVRFHERLDAAGARRVLEGYRGRYAAVRDAVTETEPRLRDDLLGDLDLVDLLTEPVLVLAQHWRSPS